MDNDSNGKKMEDGSTDHDSGSLIPALGTDLSIKCLVHLSRQDYASVALMNQSFRSVIQGGMIFKLRRQMGFIEHWVYLACQLLQWNAFDPSSLKWFKLPLMRTGHCFKFADKESLAVSTQLLVFGKEIESNVVYKYSILTNSWSIGAKPISPRCLFASTQLLVFGKEIESNVVYKYSILTNSWSIGAKPISPRCLFASASIREIGIIVGGCSPEGDVLSSAELYNSETGNWETLPSMNTPRKLCSAVIIDGKYFYAIGGIGVDKSTPLASAEVFDIEKRTWHEIPNMLALHNRENSGPQSAATKAPPLVAAVKNELYGAFCVEREVKKYDKKRNIWITVGNLPEQSTCSSMNGWGIMFRACGDLVVVIGGPMTSVGRLVEINAWEPKDDGAPLQWTVLGRKICGSFVNNCAVMGC